MSLSALHFNILQRLCSQGVRLSMTAVDISPGTVSASHSGNTNIKGVKFDEYQLKVESEDADMSCHSGVFWGRGTGF